MRHVLVAALCVATAVAVLGCGRGRRPVRAVERATVHDAGLVTLRTPVYLQVTSDESEPAADGVPSRLRIWEARTPVFALMVASLERTAPFTGARDEILASAMGERIRNGSLGEVTYDYRAGIFTARAEARDGGAAVRVVAFMSRRRLIVVMCGGRAEPVESTMRSIELRPGADELFFDPEGTTDEAGAVVWGLGFSCRMPGAVTVDEREGSLRYRSTSGDRRAAVYVLGEGASSPSERLSMIRGTGTVIDERTGFDGGARFSEVLVQSGAGWSAWRVTDARTFQMSGPGAPTSRDRDAVTAFFRSCVY